MICAMSVSFGPGRRISLALAAELRSGFASTGRLARQLAART
jgi:hypothetical protein